jgi:hypothetical protein
MSWCSWVAKFAWLRLASLRLASPGVAWPRIVLVVFADFWKDKVFKTKMHFQYVLSAWKWWVIVDQPTDRPTIWPTDWPTDFILRSSLHRSAIVAAENELLYCIIESLQASIARVA